MTPTNDVWSTLDPNLSRLKPEDLEQWTIEPPLFPVPPIPQEDDEETP